MSLRLTPKALVLGLTAASLYLAPAASDQEVKLLPEGPGKDAVARLCLDCHGTGNFRKLRLARDNWADQVAEMVDRGAKGTEAELTSVVDYLTQNFGENSKVNVNTAPLIELRAILGVSVPEAQALIAYREANGNFKEWRDLQKVSGVDAKKIEGKKDLMAF